MEVDGYESSKMGEDAVHVTIHSNTLTLYYCGPLSFYALCVIDDSEVV